MPIVNAEEKRKREEEMRRRAAVAGTLPTPEEEQERKASAREFLRKREKLRGKGATMREATAQVVAEEKATEAGEFAAGVPLRQQEIIERERQKREGIPEPITTELPPETLQPIAEQALVEPELTYTEKQPLLKALFSGIKLPEDEKLMMGTLPITPAGAAISTAKVATSSRAIKLWEGTLKALKTNWKKLFKWGGIGYVLWSERSIGNIDSALSQVRESITLPVSLAATNPYRIQDAYDMITDLEADFREYESDVKLKENFTPTMKLTGRTNPIYQRIKKLDSAIALARQQIAKTEAMGTILSPEETTIMLNEMSQLLNQMEDPSKFLGII